MNKTWDKCEDDDIGFSRKLYLMVAYVDETDQWLAYSMSHIIRNIACFVKTFFLKFFLNFFFV